MSEPQDDVAADESPRLRPVGVLTGGLGALALLAAAVAFWIGGPPYGARTAAVVLYAAGLLLGLIGSVLLYMSWTHRAVRPAEAGRGIAAAVAALVLVCACTVISLGDVAGGGVQVALMAVTGVVLAAATLLARRGA